jgi:hypothetical protein
MTNYKKVIFTVFIAFFSFSGLLTPRPANAFSDIIGGPVAFVKWVWEQTERVYDTVQGIVGAELSNRTVGMFLDSVAYDVATQIAEGGPGGKPQFRTKSIKANFEDHGRVALGEFLGELTEKGFDELGINLCDPSVELKLTLTLGLIDQEAPPEKSLNRGCSWNQLKKNWEDFDDNVQADIIKFQLNPVKSGTTSTIDFFKGIASRESSDLGMGFELEAELNKRKLEAEKVLELTTAECKGYIDNKTAITDEVITHCSVNEGMSKNMFTSATEIEAAKQLKKKEAAEAVPLSSILKDAGSKFLNTFTSKLMKNWIQKGMWSLFGTEDEDLRSGLIEKLRGGANIRQPRGADIFKEIKTVNIEGLESFDFISDFTICPDQFRGPDNCVMSPAFLQAINSKVTLREAVEQGIIDGNMPFINKNDALNHTLMKCYRDGLCYSNLVKLRKANIIPVGWELAASRAPVSLQQAMDCFEETNEKCTFKAPTNAENPNWPYKVDGNNHNPFYHLVDPDWVMKGPDVRCDAYGYTDILQSPDGSNRQQYCADPKICLREDSDGNCLEDQFSYCTRSENIWNFEGDACAAGELYAGCLNFSNKDFGKASYIQDTLDYCNANQAGCRRYSQYKDGENNWRLEPIDADPNDLFLNSQAVECNGSDAGCSEYIVLAPDTGANILPNGDFEVDLDANNQADGYGGDDNLVSGEGVGGSNAVLAAYRSAAAYPSPGTHLLTCYPGFTTLPNTNYTISVDARLNPLEPGTGGARIAVNNCFDINGADGGLTENEVWMDTTNDFGRPLDIEANLVVPVSELNDTTYTRISGTFNSGNSVSCSSICVGSNYSVPATPTTALDDFPHYFDNLKVEAVTEPIVNTSYSDYGVGAKIYMDAATVMCIADEVGCQGYRPSNGDPMIPAVITQDDLCPAECLNYDTFTEQIDDFDIIEDDLDVEYYNFIPDTARQCPDQEVGCEEFTNLDVVAEGGEGKEYFTYLRQCVEEDLGKVFYTWEGTEVAGYQIKTWYTLPGLGAAPCTNMAPEGSLCLDVNFVDDGFDDVNEIAACDEDTLDTADDIENNSNCREFFDVDGNIYYRLQDRVIFATNNCHDYRRTETNQIYKAVPEESVHCADTNNGCRAYYGNNANNVRVILSDNFEQGTYAPWERDSSPTIDLSGVSLSNNGHSLKVETDHSFQRNVMNLNLENNKDYKISWWMKSDTALQQLFMMLIGGDSSGLTLNEWLIEPNTDSNFENIEPNRWHYYTASVRIEGLDILNPDLIDELDIHIGTTADLAGQGLYIDNFTIKKVENSFAVVRNSWNTPVSCDDPYDGYYLGCQLYTDLNKQDFNLKSFDRLCREEAIGCLPVIDTKNSTNPFEETFGWYCSDPALETEDTCLTAGETWLEDYSSITIEEDSLTYLVPDPNNYCAKSAKGCTELGVPDRLDDTDFSTVYKLNDPDKYNSILCSSEGLNCAEYNSPKGSFYFKDPGAETCTYQQNTLIENNLLSGWFKTSTLGDFTPLGCADTDNDYDSDGNGFYDLNELILPRDYCSVAETNPIPMPFFTREDCEATSICIEDATQNQVPENQTDCEANALYTWSSLYWNDYLKAAQCPVQENLCTSFKDPVDPIDCDPKGRNIDFPYYEGYCLNGIVPALEDNLSDCETAGHRWVTPSRYGYCDSSVYNNKKDCIGFGHNWTDYCKDYYYYDDKKIDTGSCNGLVNRQDGCVLFYDANDWDAEHNQVTTIYDANETYENVEVLNLATSPVACNPEWNPSCVLSSNRIIKVSKDRQCAEWLACKSSAASYNKDTEEYKIICDELGSCIDFQYDPDSNTTKCKKWGSFDDTDEALTIEKYQSRNTGFRNHVSWSDKEYIGYSIPNLLPISVLSVLDFGDGEDSSKRLIYNITDSSDGDGAYFADCVEFVVGVRTPLDGESCTANLNRDGNYYFKGECKESICWLSPEVNQSDILTYSLETRVYAKSDSPFPAEIEPIVNSSERIAKYDQANICTNIDSATNSCELDFKEVSYGSGQKTYYYAADTDTADIPPGICTSGVLLEDELKGTPKECDENKDCDSFDDNNDPSTTRRDGMCSLRTDEISFKNWPGICLEYDYDIPVTRDGENSYHCNQWYPVEKIKGTSSLYDNYNLAGYSEPNGRDALFCSVAEPHITTEDRVYCVTARGDNCTRLVRVPAGARIDMEGLYSNQEIVFRNYVRDDAYYYGEPDDININTDCYGIPGGAGVCDTYGLERIENTGPGAHFNLDYDFEPQGERAAVYSLGAIERTFDTSHDENIDIEIYYFDRDVDFEGNYNGSASIMSTKGFEANWGPETRLCDRQTLPVGWECGDHYQYIFAGYKNDLLRRNTPGGDYHEIYDTGIWKCENKRWAKDKHCREVRCNPGPKSYYVKAVHPVGPWRCEDDDCSAGLLPDAKGVECIETAFPVDYPAAVAMADISECGAAGADPECEFLYCIAHDTVTDSHNDPAKYIRNGINYTLENNVTYCSDFGYSNSWSIEVQLNYNYLNSCYFEETLEPLEGCLQYLYDLVPMDMFDVAAGLTGCHLMGDNSNNNALPESQGGYSGDFTFNTAVLKSSVDPTFAETILGIDNEDAAYTPGCLSYDIAEPTNANCSREERIPDWTTYTWSWTDGEESWEVYPIELTAGDCDGPANDRPLNCYQQCRILTRLDSEGDLSTVRTDIWWRNEKQSEEAESTGDYNRIGNDVWQSYYWAPSGDYIISTLPLTNDDDVLYGSISAYRPEIEGYPGYPENFSHFGAGLGVFSEDKLFTTRVPYHKDDSVEKPTAATFFAYYNPSLAIPTLDTVVDDALVQMNKLFAEVYNLEWDGSNYEFDEIHSTRAGDGNNPFADDEYDPRILAVCGEFLCDEKDADNNVIVGSVVEGISVNGITSGTLQGQDSSLFVSVKFFYHAHPDRMPITSVNVAWGDDVLNDSVLNIGKYTNSLPSEYCNPESIAPGLAVDQKMGFGGTEDACRSAYKVFYHDYLYDATGEYRCDGAPAGEPNIITENASCYQPSATVYDNWGEDTRMPFGGWVVVYED